jgi:hypothetical protein
MSNIGVFKEDTLNWLSELKAQIADIFRDFNNILARQAEEIDAERKQLQRENLTSQELEYAYYQLLNRREEEKKLMLDCNRLITTTRESIGSTRSLGERESEQKNSCRTMFAEYKSNMPKREKEWKEHQIKTSADLLECKVSQRKLRGSRRE